MSERVDHPNHYGGDTTYEAIKVIEAWGLGFCLGNCVKYVCRAGKKSDNRLEDLRKALWYLRAAEGAQFEIRQYANVVADAVKTAFPRTYELFAANK